jgi:hypothetical protein
LKVEHIRLLEEPVRGGRLFCAHTVLPPLGCLRRMALFKGIKGACGKENGFKSMIKLNSKQNKTPGICALRYYPTRMMNVSSAAFHLGVLVVLAFFPP